MKVLCVFGQYQYGDRTRGFSEVFAGFMPALRRLGCDIVHFESWNRAAHENYRDLNVKLVDCIRTTQPDVMLTVQLGYELWTETIGHISEVFDTATVTWTTDDSWKFREVSRFIAPYYHAITTTYAHRITDYHKLGIQSVLLTQWAASLDGCKQPVPAARCRYPVSFVGTMYGRRAELVQKLRAEGIPVSCFGFGWPEGPVQAGMISDIMNNSVISLNFSAGAKGPEPQIKARAFEVPGAGSLLLTEDCPGLERYYTVGGEIDSFRTFTELKDKIDGYLANPGLRDRMARAAFERTVKEHTYDHRLKEVIEFALRAKTYWHPPRRLSAGSEVTVCAKAHRPTRPIRWARTALVALCTILWARGRAVRAARRIAYECSWRLVGERTFGAGGWPGRMFPEI